MTDENYDLIFQSPGGALISYHEVKTMLEILDYPSEMMVLDVGTGTGRIAIHLTELGNDVVGLDIDWDRIATANLKAKKKGSTISLWLMDSTSLSKSQYSI